MYKSSKSLGQNLPEFYEKSSIDGKQWLIGSIFTENLIFKNKKFEPLLVVLNPSELNYILQLTYK